MDRRAFLAFLVTSPVFATSFDDFLANETAGFEEFKSSLLEEFEEYVRVINEEFSNYKKSLSNAWLEPEISSSHKWVQYSKDFFTRSIVDFEKNTLKIESVGGFSGDKEAQIKQHLNRILQQDTKSAVENDMLIGHIEARLAGLPHVIKGDIPKSDSILGLAFSEDKVEADSESVIALQSEIVDANGKPVYRSFPGEQQITASSGDSLFATAKKGKDERQANGKTSDHVVIKLSSKFLKRRAEKQEPVVLDKSSKYRVNFSALMALMHTESSFNPMALSESAYGLLMINPETSGRVAHKKIYGNEKIISPTYLYNNVNNIELGSAYFNLLYHKYLKGVENPVSRLYCAIVSYNAGLGNVARTFSGRPVLRKAIGKINEKDPDAVFKTFQDRLPFEESKIYLTKVKERLSYYIQASD
ncbi:MAG TPA: DUF3393 domain-containing protein [Gammaproteobacteria bacterium]|nr:DUF3393 domain-containing protein [Gammaproteobacteria bacterium]